MKKIFALALAVVMLAAMTIVPASAADLNDNVIVWIDFEGENPLADKAPAGAVADAAEYVNDDANGIKIENGIAFVPAAEGGAYVGIPMSDDTADMNGKTIYLRHRASATVPSTNYGSDFIKLPGLLRDFTEGGGMDGLGFIYNRVWYMNQTKDPYVMMTNNMLAPDGEMVHTAYTFEYADQTLNVKCYISFDGVNYTEYTHSMTGIESIEWSGNIELGHGNGRAKDFHIDDFRVYNKILTADEIAGLADDVAPAAGAATPADTTAAPADTTAAPADTTAAPADTTAAPATTTAAPTTTPTTADSAVLFVLFGAAALLTLTVGLRRRTSK